MSTMPTVRTRVRRDASPGADPAVLKPIQRGSGRKVVIRTANPVPSFHRVALDAFREGKPVGKAASGSNYHPQQQLDDPFLQAYQTVAAGGATAVIMPPYNFYSLMRLPHENGMLGSCIDAMVTNIEGHGYRLEYVGPDPDTDSVVDSDAGGDSPSVDDTNPKDLEGGENSPAALREKAVLEDFLNYPNDDHSMQELRERVRRDYETLGNAFIEVGRDRTGRINMMAHIPAHTMRLTNKDTEATTVEVMLPRNGTMQKIKRTKRFRRFVQMVGYKRVYFKEYGDPRLMDPATGIATASVSFENSCTEVIHLFNYTTSNTPYGLPRWINNLPAILGTREAELTNLDFFQENAIPALALLVSGGQITQETVDGLEEQFLSGKGRANMNRMVIIEVQGDPTSASSEGTVPAPKVQLQPLNKDRQGDGLFEKYIAAGQDATRSSFRIPPVFVGHSQDYTHATASVSFEVAESQVFGPERQRFDDMINLKVLSTYNAKFWKFRSNPSRITDPESVVKALQTFDTLGAMTPNIAISMANEYFDMDVKPIAQTWGDWPFVIVRDLAAKRQLDGIEEITVLDVLHDDMTQATIDRGLALQEAGLNEGGEKADPQPAPDQGGTPGGGAPAGGGKKPASGKPAGGKKPAAGGKGKKPSKKDVDPRIAVLTRKYASMLRDLRKIALAAA